MMLRRNIKYPVSNQLSEGFALDLKGSRTSSSTKKVNSPYLRNIITQKEKGEGDFSKMGQFKINRPDFRKVCSISSSTDDMYLVLTIMFNHKQEYAVPVTKKDDRMESKTIEVPFGGINSLDGRMEIFVFNVAVVDAVKTMLKDPFQAIQPSGTHWGNLNSIDICPTKHIMLSLGEDHTFKLWDIGSDYQGLYSEFMFDHPLCASIHPFSIQCAIGYKDSVRIFYILELKLKCVFNYPLSKMCRVVAYNEGGNYLAAGHGGKISIFDTFNLKVLYVLKAHSNDVVSIQWLEHDKFILTQCLFGSVNAYNTNWTDNKQFIEKSRDQNKLLCATYDPHYDVLVKCCNDANVYLFIEKGFQQMCKYMPEDGVKYTSVLIVHKLKVIIFGTEIGSIRVYLWPWPKAGTNTKEYIEFAIHQGMVTKIKMTYNYQYLITSSIGGSIFFSQIKEYQDGQIITQFDQVKNVQTDTKEKNQKKTNQFSNTYFLSNFLLINELALQQKADKIKQLGINYTNTADDKEDRIEQLKGIYSQKIKTSQEKKRDSTTKQKEILASAMEKADEKIKSLLFQIRLHEKKSQKVLEGLQQKNQEDLLSEYAINDELQKELEETDQQFKDKLEEVKTEHQQLLERQEQHYQKEHKKLYQQYQKAVEDMEQDNQEYNQAVLQAEEEHKEDVQKTQENLKIELKRQKDQGEELRKDNTKLSKENQKLIDCNADLKNIKDEIIQDNKRLKEEQQKFENRKQKLEIQLEKKEDYIKSKEDALLVLRKTNHGLQDFREVCNHIVQQRKEEQEPLIEHNENLEKHIMKMQHELLDEANQNKKLASQVEAQQLKIKQQQSKMKKRNHLLCVSKRKHDNIIFDLQQILRNRDFKHWKVLLAEVQKQCGENIKNVTKALPTGGVEEQQNSDNQKQDFKKNVQNYIRQELLKQRNFHSSKLNQINTLNQANENERKEKFVYIQGQNTNLINECNNLRTEKHSFQNKIGGQLKKAKDLAKEMSVILQRSIPVQQKQSLGYSMGKRPAQKEKKNDTGLTNYQQYQHERKQRVIKQTISQEQQQFVQESAEPKKKTNILSSLLKEIDKHNKVTVEQGQNMENLQENMRNFLHVQDIEPEGYLPPIVNRNEGGQMNELNDRQDAPFQNEKNTSVTRIQKCGKATSPRKNYPQEEEKEEEEEEI